MASSCPVSRADFREKAQAVNVTINGVPLTAQVKEFSTGSFGWYLTGKVTIDVGGRPVVAQVGMNLAVVGSKDLPRDKESPKDSESPKEA